MSRRLIIRPRRSARPLLPARERRLQGVLPSAASRVRGTAHRAERVPHRSSRGALCKFAEPFDANGWCNNDWPKWDEPNACFPKKQKYYPGRDDGQRRGPTIAPSKFDTLILTRLGFCSTAAHEDRCCVVIGRRLASSATPTQSVHELSSSNSVSRASACPFLLWKAGRVPSIGQCGREY